jgi:glycolate oxidase FAD binding subunit
MHAPAEADAGRSRRPEDASANQGWRHPRRPGRAASPASSLNTSGQLKGVSLYEPGALTIVAAAGTPLDTVEKALAKENQRLAFEPMDHRALYGTNGKPTIGGVVAANVSGPRRIQAGAAAMP